MVMGMPDAPSRAMAEASSGWIDPSRRTSVPSTSTARSLYEGSGMAGWAGGLGVSPIVTAGRSGGGGVDRDLLPRVGLPLELHDAVDQREEREVLARPDVLAGVD